MRSAVDITIQRAIIHGINPRIVDGFVLSETCLPIRRTDPMALFLANHIQKALHDQAVRAARFEDGNAPVADLYGRMLDGRRAFVAASQEIATQLYAIVQNDGRISPGALAICFFQAANHAHVRRYLAVLKLDQGDAFQTTTATDQRGRRYVTFSTVRDVMPTSRERLQKCAFLRPLDPRPDDYDMMVLDRQHGADEPAQFFTRDFLAASLASDPGTLTRQFYRGAISGLGSVRNQISETDYNRLRTAINGAVHSQSITIDDWVQNLRGPRVARDALLAAVRREVPDAVIETDARVADELTRKRVIKGRHALKLSFESAHEREILQNCTPRHSANKGDYVEVILHVQDFREESR